MPRPGDGLHDSQWGNEHSGTRLLPHDEEPVRSDGKQLGSGQWAMILSGAQSMIAGVAYFSGGLYDKRHIKDVGGYATFGALYFLVGGILLTRRLSKLSTLEAN